MDSTRTLRACLFAWMALAAAPARADDDDDVKDVPSVERLVGKDTNKRYFLIGPAKEAKRPAGGYGLIILLPGGSGTADFHPFAKRVYKNAVPDGYVVAQPVAVKWTPNQEIVWPTAVAKVAGAKFTTEEFVDAVIEDVKARHPLDPKKVFTLSWSSSGPAAYPISLTNPTVRGSFVAMSVFKPDDLPPLTAAKGHAYFLYHSNEDRVCPYAMAETAEAELAKAGAEVKFRTYDGGHGWHGAFHDDIRDGIVWLETNATAPPRRK